MAKKKKIGKLKLALVGLGGMTGLGIIAVIIGIIAAGGVGPFTEQLADMHAEMSGLGVFADEVTEAEFVLTADEEGIIHCITDRVISTPVSGTFKGFHADPGTEVKEGDVLFEIEDEAYRAAVEGTEAELAMLMDELANARVETDDAEAAQAVKTAGEQLEFARLSLETARRKCTRARDDFEEYTELRESRSVSEQLFENYQDAWQTATEEVARWERMVVVRQTELELTRLRYDRTLAVGDTRLRALQAAVASARSDLSKTVVHAPFDGVVLRRFQEDSAVLPAGTPVLEIGDLTRLELRTDLLAEDAARVRPGMEVLITGEVLRDREITGTVRRIDPAGFTDISALGVEQQRVWVVIDFDNSAGLMPGWEVDCAVVLLRRQSLTAPESSVFKHNGGHAVFVIRGARAELVEVEVGESNPDCYEVESGVEAGDLVILDPPRELSSGTVVKIVE